MEAPFILIEGKVTRREKFDISDGVHPTCALLYIKEGSFSLNLGGRPQTVSAGDTVLFNDSESFSRRVMDPIVFVYIKFRINEKCPFALPLPTGKVEFADKARFLSSISQYEAILDCTDRPMVYYKRHLLEDILFQLYLAARPTAEREGVMSQDERIRAAVDYIHRNLSGPIRIDSICRAVGTNPSTLNWHFRREFGRPVGDFVNAERMRLAKRLLLGTNFTVGEIASRCGFENVYYFSTAFRNACGMPPTAWRKEYGI